MTLRNFLIKTRSELGLTRKEIADMLQLTEKDIWMMEYGEMMWNTETLEKKARRIIREAKNRDHDKLDSVR